MHSYSRTEWERRCLLESLPRGKPWAVRQIVDRYLNGTRLRLRRTDGIVNGRPESALKFTQKIAYSDPSAGHQGEITTIYLEPCEYQALESVPAAVLRKVRHSFPPLGVDVFEGPLEGLILAEIEFESEAEMLAYPRPPCLREVTGDQRYTGGYLVQLNPDEAFRLVALSRGVA